MGTGPQAKAVGRLRQFVEAARDQRLKLESVLPEAYNVADYCLTRPANSD